MGRIGLSGANAGLWGSAVKISASRCFSMQGAGTPAPPTGLPLGEGRAKDAIEQCDAAAICAGMSKKIFLAGRVKWMQDYASAAMLERFLWVEASGLASRERWPLCIGQTTLRTLSELAVAETLDPTRFRTEAAKVLWFGNSTKIDPDKVWRSWERVWRSRYQAIYEILERWADISASHIKYRQREDGED